MAIKFIVGLVGRARVGKDTFAEMLADELFEIIKSRFVLMAYSQELKTRVQKDFDLRYEQLWGNEKEVLDERYVKQETISGPEYWTGREILQAYGQFFRTIDSNFWVNNLFSVIDLKGYKNIIITDVRHINEATAIKNAGGFLIKIISNREGMPEIHGSQHISETAMDDYTDIDLTVTNNQGLEELRSVAKSAAELIISIKKMNVEAQNG